MRTRSELTFQVAMRISYSADFSRRIHTAAMKAGFFDWIRVKRLLVGEWLYWRRALSGRPARRRRRRKTA